MTAPVETDAKIVPPVRPANPPTMLLGPVLVTDPADADARIRPGPFSKLSAPMKPPSTLLPPPVTFPNAKLLAMNPSLAPTRPPATLVAPTVTLPNACESKMKAVLKVALPSPMMQPAQLKLLIEFDATSPPALLPSPACTVPAANDDTMVPELSPTRPPACRFATFRPPTSPIAPEFEIRP